MLHSNKFITTIEVELFYLFGKMCYGSENVRYPELSIFYKDFKYSIGVLFCCIVTCIHNRHKRCLKRIKSSPSVTFPLNCVSQLLSRLTWNQRFFLKLSGETPLEDPYTTIVVNRLSFSKLTFLKVIH